MLKRMLLMIVFGFIQKIFGVMFRWIVVKVLMQVVVMLSRMLKVVWVWLVVQRFCVVLVKQICVCLIRLLNSRLNRQVMFSISDILKCQVVNSVVSVSIVRFRWVCRCVCWVRFLVLGRVLVVVLIFSGVCRNGSRLIFMLIQVLLMVVNMKVQVCRENIGILVKNVVRLQFIVRCVLKLVMILLIRFCSRWCLLVGQCRLMLLVQRVQYRVLRNMLMIIILLIWFSGVF